MLRLLGILCLSFGCMGFGWSFKDRLKRGLEEAYQARQMFLLLQNEIVYSRASLPEACFRAAGRIPEPYRGAFLKIHEEMSANHGTAFDAVWRGQMKECVRKLALSGEEKGWLLELGNCVGFMDGRMQAQILEQYARRLELSIEKQEREMADKSKVIMCLSVMGGLMVVVVLI